MDTRVVSVADREGDIYELLLAAQPHEAADLLQRVRQDRRLAGSEQTLQAHLDAQPPEAEVEVNIPRRGNQPARVARLVVRHDRVMLQPPRDKHRLGPVELDAVRATETDPPQGAHSSSAPSICVASIGLSSMKGRTSRRSGGS